jgi:hypothetical protein
MRDRKTEKNGFHRPPEASAPSYSMSLLKLTQFLTQQSTLNRLVAGRDLSDQTLCKTKLLL